MQKKMKKKKMRKTKGTPIGPLVWSLPSLYGGIFSRKPERVPAHWMNDIAASQSMKPGHSVTESVDSDVTHVQFATRVRKHGQDIVLVFRAVCLKMLETSVFKIHEKKDTDKQRTVKCSAVVAAVFSFFSLPLFLSFPAVTVLLINMPFYRYFATFLWPKNSKKPFRVYEHISLMT